MLKEIYETQPDRLHLLDTKDGVWRVAIRESTGLWIQEESKYENGDIVVLTTQQYVDADRAGVVGYFGHSVALPVCILLEVADAIRAGEIPRSDDE